MFENKIRPTGGYRPPMGTLLLFLLLLLVTVPFGYAAKAKRDAVPDTFIGPHFGESSAELCGRLQEYMDARRHVTAALRAQYCQDGCDFRPNLNAGCALGDSISDAIPTLGSVKDFIDAVIEDPDAALGKSLYTDDRLTSDYIDYLWMCFHAMIVAAVFAIGQARSTILVRLVCIVGLSSVGSMVCATTIEFLVLWGAGLVSIAASYSADLSGIILINCCTVFWVAFSSLLLDNDLLLLVFGAASVFIVLWHMFYGILNNKAYGASAFAISSVQMFTLGTFIHKIAILRDHTSPVFAIIVYFIRATFPYGSSNSAVRNVLSNLGSATRLASRFGCNTYVIFFFGMACTLVLPVLCRIAFAVTLRHSVVLKRGKYGWLDDLVIYCCDIFGFLGLIKQLMRNPKRISATKTTYAVVSLAFFVHECIYMFDLLCIRFIVLVVCLLGRTSHTMPSFFFLEGFDLGGMTFKQSASLPTVSWGAINDMCERSHRIEVSKEGTRHSGTCFDMGHGNYSTVAHVAKKAITVKIDDVHSADTKNFQVSAFDDSHDSHVTVCVGFDSKSKKPYPVYSHEEEPVSLMLCTNDGTSTVTKWNYINDDQINVHTDLEFGHSGSMIIGVSPGGDIGAFAVVSAGRLQSSAGNIASLVRKRIYAGSADLASDSTLSPTRDSGMDYGDDDQRSLAEKHADFICAQMNDPDGEFFKHAQALLLDSDGGSGAERSRMRESRKDRAARKRDFISSDITLMRLAFPELDSVNLTVQGFNAAANAPKGTKFTIQPSKSVPSFFSAYAVYPDK